MWIQLSLVLFDCNEQRQSELKSKFSSLMIFLSEFYQKVSSFENWPVEIILELDSYIKVLQYKSTFFTRPQKFRLQKLSNGTLYTN